jgi:drug/metabolite transporter (DMT)-like permease
MVPKALAYFKLTLAVTFWGASFVATKWALRELSPAAVVATRFAVGFLVLILFLAVRRGLRRPPLEAWPLVVLLGFQGIGLHQWLQSNGLLTTEASVTSWIVATTPVFVAILGWAFLRERLGLARAAGILLAALGAWVMALLLVLAAILVGVVMVVIGLAVGAGIWRKPAARKDI